MVVSRALLVADAPKSIVTCRVSKTREYVDMNSNNQAEAPLTIAPVTVDDLEKSISDKKIDPGTQKLLAAERSYIIKRRKKFRELDEQKISNEGVPRDLIGLALSGGGIRSATFSLGVMQALSRSGFLNKVDYLSTVSGGGYIGSAVTWFTSGISKSKTAKGEFSTRKEEFPFGTDDPGPESVRSDSRDQNSILRYIRQHGNYLAPGAGISLISLLGVVLRGTILNLAVWLPLFGLLFFGVLLAGPEFAGLMALLQEAPGFGVYTALLPKAPVASGFEFFTALLLLGGVIIVLLVIFVFVYSFLTWLRRMVKNDRLWYRLRRGAEKAAAFLIPTAIISLVFGSLPIVDKILVGELIAVGPVSIIAGIGVAIKSFMGSGSSEKGAPVGIVVPLASALLLYGVFLVSYQIAFHGYMGILTPYLVPIIGFAAALAYFVNLNYIAIHRYYRDRLMETFMPDLDSALGNETAAAVGADSAKISEFAKVTNTPYHIVNTNLILVNSKIPRYQSRGGDNFILSPQYCGSNATGWRESSKFMMGKMTLATAVAISGAAANPNSGVGGAGLTRNKFLSLVMSLLNLKLGYWASNPHEKHHTIMPANHFEPGIYSLGNALGIRGFREDRKYVQLSDGGHFENTGVYELIRRRAKLIIVCDGGADPDTSFSDFQTTVRRVEDDFGARIKIDDDESPDKVVPTAQEKAPYPKDGKFAQQGFIRGKITYADDSDGTIIYLKTTLIMDVSFKVKGYAASNPDFPDQSTADQFFDEIQFEAYRELGHAITSQMLKSPAVKRDLEV